MKLKYQILTIMCWIIYIACLVFKICGAEWFTINCTNETFISICNYVDNTQWLKMTIAGIMSLILNSLMIFAMFREKFYTRKQALIFIPLIIGMSISGWYYPYVQLALNIICAVILPLILRAKFSDVFVGNILIIVFQAMSLFTKNIGNWNINETNFLVATILQLDSLIMLIIYYLYANSLNIKKEER